MDDSGKSFFGHPAGLAVLFMTEVWERFSYYGMRALLVLYMTAPESSGGLGFSVARAGAIYGMYTAMVYLLSLPGGWIADSFLGQRRSVLYGGILIAIGNGLLALSGEWFFYGGLAISALGTGLLKPNVSVMVGQLYGPEDRRRDAGFSIFYMGINLGAFVAPLVCGYLGQKVNWHLGFAAAALGMVAGLLQYGLGATKLGVAGLQSLAVHNPEAARARARKLWRTLQVVLLGGAVAIALHAVGLLEIGLSLLSNALGLILLGSALAFFGWAAVGSGFSSGERKRMAAVAVLFLGSMLFWSMFEQAGSTLNLFAERSTNRHILGFEFPASWMQSLNALFIIGLAPAFAWLWVRLGPREPSSPAKFALGLAAAAAGFGLLGIAASQVQTGRVVSPLWLVGVYFLHTVGELCLSPVGLSAMTKLAPARIGGLLMGVWFLSLAAGNYLGGKMASLYEAMPLTTLFFGVAAYGGLAALVLLLVAGRVRRLMGEA